MVKFWGRMRRHILPFRGLEDHFPEPVLTSIEKAVGKSEKSHSGEIRFVVEESLSLGGLWRGLSARRRAEEVFSTLRVWDTEGNSGVLIYVLLADRNVEILADRGLNEKVTPKEWEEVCQTMETHYRRGDFEKGSLAGIAGVSRLLSRHFPAQGPNPNELPNAPVLL